jgi:hypothetical protein
MTVVRTACEPHHARAVDPSHIGHTGPIAEFANYFLQFIGHAVEARFVAAVRVVANNSPTMVLEHDDRHAVKTENL